MTLHWGPAPAAFPTSSLGLGGVGVPAARSFAAVPGFGRGSSAGSEGADGPLPSAGHRPYKGQ
jgi:hypothetical protein